MPSAERQGARRKYRPEESTRLVARAKEYLQSAYDRWDRKFYVGACQDLHAASELALKALITATDSGFEKTHDLLKLWNEAEGRNGKIEERPNEGVLCTITEYAGDARYDSAPHHDPVKTFIEYRDKAETIVGYADKRVPELLQKLTEPKRRATI